jgi:hypothetical protein
MLDSGRNFDSKRKRIKEAQGTASLYLSFLGVASFGETVVHAHRVTWLYCHTDTDLNPPLQEIPPSYMLVNF